MIQEVYVIEKDTELTSKLKKTFKEDRAFRFKSIKPVDLENALKSIPELIIINEDSIENDILNLCKRIRGNEDNSITPIIVISSNNDPKHKLAIIKNSVEYYIEEAMGEEFLYNTIKNLLRLLYVNRRISPLTGLPGNVQIQAELKKRLMRREDFEVLYFDLDNFKAYNDVYGFIKGDEIIKLTARIVTKNIHNYDDLNVFIGHIGGDDFIAIVDKETDYERICQNIIAEFDLEVLKCFKGEDIERGYLEVQNRKGIVEEFPLTSISIGVVVVDKKRFNNILEIGEVGAQVKHLAKTTVGSSYAIDRRA